MKKKTIFEICFSVITIVLLFIMIYGSYQRDKQRVELENRGCVPELTLFGAHCKVCGESAQCGESGK